MIRTFLFDMGNVLFRFSHARMYAQVGELFCINGSDVESQLTKAGLLVDFECGRISEADLHHQLEQLFGRTVQRADLLRAAADIFELNEPMPMLLQELKSRGHRLVVLSNTNSAHVSFLRSEYDLLDLFDDFCFSHEVGAIKPELAIYEAALKMADCEPEECFYTDDIAHYVDVARKEFGIQAEVFTTPQNLAAKLKEMGVLSGEAAARLSV